MMKKAIRVIVLSVVFLCSFSGLLRANSLPVDGGWQTFSWSGLGKVFSPATGYQLTALGPVVVQVVDCCIIGDQFRVTKNGGTALITSDPSPFDGIQSGKFDGASAWLDPRLSKGSFLVGAGVWQLDIYTIRLASGTSTGGAFIQAVATPEPGTLMLLGSGLLALGGFRRRKINS